MPQEQVAGAKGDHTLELEVDAVTAEGVPTSLATAADTGPMTRSAGYDVRLIAISAAGFCVFLSVYATQALLPLLRDLFHATELHASMTVTATTLAVAIAAPAVGLLAERVGRKQVIVTAIFLLAIPTFLAATSPTLNWLIFWRFVQGLIMPGIIAVTMAYVAEEWPANQVGKAMGAYVSGNVLAGVTGRFLTGWIAAHFRWNDAFLLLGVLDLAGGVFVWKGLPHPRKTGKPVGSVGQSLREMAGHLQNRSLLAAYAAGFNILLVLVAIFTYITYHLHAPPYGLGPAQLGSLFLVYLLGVVVTPLGGLYIDRVGQKTAELVALFIVAVGVALTAVPSIPAMVVGLAVCSSGIFICQSATASYMGLIAGRARASAAGLYATCYYLGGATGAFLPGLIWQWGGWNACVVFILLVTISTGGAVAFWKRPAAFNK